MVMATAGTKSFLWIGRASNANDAASTVLSTTTTNVPNNNNNNKIDCMRDMPFFVCTTLRIHPVGFKDTFFRHHRRRHHRRRHLHPYHGDCWRFKKKLMNVWNANMVDTDN
eukprot:scaffold16935_cov88-Cylindrotheca_fusiformis.AAC.1